MFFFLKKNYIDFLFLVHKSGETMNGCFFFQFLLLQTKILPKLYIIFRDLFYYDHQGTKRFFHLKPLYNEREREKIFFYNESYIIIKRSLALCDDFFSRIS